jgi:hypothetical protein
MSSFEDALNYRPPHKFEDYPPEVQMEIMANVRMWKKLLSIYAEGNLWDVIDIFKKMVDEVRESRTGYSPSISKEQEAEKP